MVVLYTIIDIKPFSNKRARSESVADDDSEEEGSQAGTEPESGGD